MSKHFIEESPNAELALSMVAPKSSIAKPQYRESLIIPTNHCSDMLLHDKLPQKCTYHATSGNQLKHSL
jgi:hypothetical protein